MGTSTSRRLHWIDTTDAFDIWYRRREEDGSTFGAKSKEIREGLIRRSRGEYCRVCGKWMPKGELVNQTSALWRTLKTKAGYTEGSLEPFHLFTCIPAFTCIFTFEHADAFLIKSDETNFAIHDDIGQLNVRTSEEALAWVQAAGWWFQEHYWDVILSYKLLCGDELLKEEKHPTFLEPTPQDCF